MLPIGLQHKWYSGGRQKVLSASVRDANRQALAYVYFEEAPGRCAAALFGLFAQADAGMRVHVMYLMTYRTSHRLIDVAVFRGIFGNKALNAVSGVWAPVYKERHAGITQRRGAGGRDLNRVVRLGQDRLLRCARVCHR
jgi:hypothetical protein